MRIFILLLVLMIPVCSIAVNLSLEFDPALFKGRSKEIDPDRSVYGVGFGNDEAKVREEFGNPSGVILISDSKRALLYGSSHMFIFKRGKLRELRVSEHLVDWELSRQMEEHPFFDSGNWTLLPGVRKEMDFEAIREKLKRPKAKPDYRFRLEG